MKTRRVLKLRSLKSPRIRQSWNKYNVWQMSKFTPRSTQGSSFFQQKWYAKSLSRAYHGEHIKERTWTRMFSRRLLSAVNMNPTYMAKFDGSEQAEGRGSGKQTRPGHEIQDQILAEHMHSVADRAKDQEGYFVDMTTPYMQQTFAPMERRLDIAVFRALFASSARQARQLVVHGNVMVNGQKMRYPGYLLNPGDMFQVDVDKVLQCTGKPKTARLLGRKRKATSTEEGEEAVEEATEESAESTEEAADAVPSTEDPTTSSAPADPPADLTPEELEAAKAASVTQLRSLVSEARRLAQTYTKDATATAKTKQRLRALTRDAKTALSKAGISTPTQNTLSITSLTDALSTLTLSTSGTTPLKTHSPTPQSTTAQESMESPSLDEDETKILDRLLREEERNPQDLSKPYRTPWVPKTYMPAFAFIPRYLQVNQKICSAVYLRHPVARPGKIEIPTPFPNEIAQLAHNWYLRRK